MGGEVYLVLKVADIAWTIYTEETGFYEDVALIDKYTKPTRFGVVKSDKKEAAAK